MLIMLIRRYILSRNRDETRFGECLGGMERIKKKKKKKAWLIKIQKRQKVLW